MKTPLRLAVLQHHPAEGPGRIRSWARARGHELSLVSAWTGMAALPPADALLLLGGPANLDAAPDWLVQELALLRPWVREGRPVFAICLGAQILAQLLGGAVRPLPQAENGWHRVDFADGRRLWAQQWHEQGIALPDGCSATASSSLCAVQAFGRGRQRGLQFHPEWDPATVADLHQHFGADCPLAQAPEPDREAALAAWFEDELDDWLRA